MLALLLATVLASDVTRIPLDGERWVVEESATMWTWSAGCAPRKLTDDAKESCEATVPLAAQVVDPKGRPVDQAHVIWATEEMLRDLADRRVPRVITGENGSAILDVPKDRDVWLRVAGPRAATHWKRVATGTGSVRLESAPAAVTRVRVRGADGNGVARARIALLPLHCTTFCNERILLADDEKQPPGAVLVPGTYQAVVWSDSHAPLHRVIAIDSEEIVLTLARGAALSAKILDAAQKPVRGAELEVQYRLPGAGTLLRRIAVASADGSVTLGGLPAAAVEWTASAPGYGRRVDGATLESPTDLGKIVLSPARRVHVVVVDEAERGIADASVIARDAAVVKTDAKGIATFEQLPAGEVELEIEANGFLYARATVPRGEARATVVLSRGAAVKATLLRERDGTSPSSVQVRVTNNGRETLESVDVASVFTLSGLRAGDLRLRIAAEGAQTYDTGSLALAEGETLDLGTLVLKSGLGLRGTIVDEDRAPIESARIRSLRTDGDSPALADVLGNWTETKSAEDGAFRLHGFTPGAQLVVVEASGFAQRVIPNVLLEEESGETDLGTIELARGRTVNLTCRPVRRCGDEANILLAGGDLPQLAVRAPLENGRATIHDVPPGDALLRLTRSQHVTHERRITVGRGSEPEAIDIVLPAVRVRGEVTVGSRPARGGSLRFTRAVKSSGIPILMKSRTEQGSPVGSQWIGSFGAATMSEVSTEGIFVIDELEPADYDVVFLSAGAITTKVQVSVPDVPEHQLRLRFEGHELAGTVVNADGQPNAAQISVTDGAGMVHTTGAGSDGQFRLLGLAEGRAKVKATASGRKAEAEVDPAGHDARNLVLRLSAATGGVSVAVDEDGQPAAGVLVFVIGPNGLLTASTDREGRAAFRSLDEERGAFPVAAHRPGGAWGFGTISGGTARVRLTARGGTLLAQSAKPSGSVTLVTPGGFPLERVLPMVGIVPQLSGGGSLRLSGLPPGMYSVAVGVLQKSANVTAGETAVAEFE